MNLMNDEKHFNTLSNYYKTKYGKKVFKISLNGNFKCPHSGCIFCNGSGDYAGDKNKSIKDQFDDVKNMMEKKWDDAYYIVYFQANTNTFAPLNELKAKYEEALSLSDKIIGISIATRCDSISDECLEYLKELNKKTFVQIELGLQTIHEKTSTLINRGHTLNQFDECIKRLKEAKISIVVHIINGLPYETFDMMIDTAKYVGKLGIDGIKIHMLYVMKNTKLLELYNKEKFHILTRDEYVKIVATQLEYLPLSMVIHRLTGDSAKDLLVEPIWSLKKFVVLNEIDKYMRKNNVYQGDKIKED
ncbi:MAG: TIGR01212 family radical SAM protein [bacterium]|nr:TIGR01212 family radical SAM protein [bacterium]